MKIALVYNRESKNVINLFGLPNRETYGREALQRIVDGLREYGHRVKSFEADKDLIQNLERFMPRVVKGETPGMVFNVSYGIQGQARYTHVPGILEMVGIPYVGSGPLAHSLALDKVVAKMVFLQHGLPTPPYAVLQSPDFPPPELAFPMIVKPKNESVSMGVQIVNSERELRRAAGDIFDAFHNQPVLAEQYIEGREINVGVIGNNPPEVFPPCEIVFGDTGPRIYTIEDKQRTSGREIDWICPAPLSKELSSRAKDLARTAFTALGCADAARIDMRLDRNNNLYILEINSLPSLGEHGSYTIAAQQAGLDFPALVNRLVEAASARYFGVPDPPVIYAGERDIEKKVFVYLTKLRDRMERSLQDWVSCTSRTHDPVGNSLAAAQLGRRMKELKMKPAADVADPRCALVWETEPGFAGGTLFVCHVDVPLDQSVPYQHFHRDAEWLYGEGIGVSRAPLVMIEFVLRALKEHKYLRQLPLGLLCYCDEGRECRYSRDVIRTVAGKAQRVLVLSPASGEGTIRTQRRGQRKYHLVVEGKPQRIGKAAGSPEPLLWFSGKLAHIAALSSRKERIAVSAVNVKTESFQHFLPHRITATLITSYLDEEKAESAEEKVRSFLGKRQMRWSLEQISDRPPMKDRTNSSRLAGSLAAIAKKWDIPLMKESSLLPSAGGLVPARVPAVCGIGPVARDLFTPQEAVNRGNLLQRALLIADFLLQ